MNRKKLLATAIVVLLIVGFATVLIPFGTSLSPEADTRAAEPGYFLVSNLEIGDDLILEFRGRPIMIHRTDSDSLKVWDLIPRFSNNINGCTIQRARHQQAEFPGMVYMEPCRSVSYDSEGQVLHGSHGYALPMRELSYKLEGHQLYILHGT